MTRPKSDEPVNIALATSKPTSKAWVFWLGFFGIILLLGTVSLYAALRAGNQLVQANSDSAPLKVFRVVLQGQPSAISLQDTASIREFVATHWQQDQQAVNTEIAKAVTTTLTPPFDAVLAQVPAFADWYYSLQGEYTRLAKALLGNMTGYLQDQLSAKLLSPAQFEARLATAVADLNAQAAGRLQASAAQLNQDLQRLLAKQRVAETHTASPLEVEQSLDLDPAFAQVLAVKPADIGRQVFAAGTGMATGTAVGSGLAAVTAKTVIAKVAAKSGLKTATTFLAKGGAKVASPSLAASSGALLCSPAGFGALVCGAVAGVATWLLVDKAVIEVEEQLGRQAFERDIRTAIVETREMLRADLTRAYQQALADHYQQAATAFTELLQVDPAKTPGKDFVPRKALARELKAP